MSTFGEASDQGATNEQAQPTLEAGQEQPSSQFGENNEQSPDVIAKRLADSQAYITKLEAENKAFKAQNEGSTKLDEVLELMKNREQQQPTQDPVSEPQSQLDMEALEGNVVNKLKEHQAGLELKATKKANIDNCIDQLKKQYGNTFVTQVDEIAATNGMTRQQAENLAETNPVFFMNTFGKKDFKAPPSPQGSTHAVPQGGNSEQNTVPVGKMTSSQITELLNSKEATFQHGHR